MGENHQNMASSLVHLWNVKDNKNDIFISRFIYIKKN